MDFRQKCWEKPFLVDDQLETRDQSLSVQKQLSKQRLPPATQSSEISTKVIDPIQQRQQQHKQSKKLQYNEKLNQALITKTLGKVKKIVNKDLKKMINHSKGSKKQQYTVSSSLKAAGPSDHNKDNSSHTQWSNQQHLSSQKITNKFNSSTGGNQDDSQQQSLSSNKDNFGVVGGKIVQSFRQPSPQGPTKTAFGRKNKKTSSTRQSDSYGYHQMMNGQGKFIIEGQKMLDQLKLSKNGDEIGGINKKVTPGRATDKGQEIMTLSRGEASESQKNKQSHQVGQNISSFNKQAVEQYGTATEQQSVALGSTVNLGATGQFGGSFKHPQQASNTQIQMSFSPKKIANAQNQYHEQRHGGNSATDVYQAQTSQSLQQLTTTVQQEEQPMIIDYENKGQEQPSQSKYYLNIENQNKSSSRSGKQQFQQQHRTVQPAAYSSINSQAQQHHNHLLGGAAGYQQPSSKNNFKDEDHKETSILHRQNSSIVLSRRASQQPSQPPLFLLSSDQGQSGLDRVEILSDNDSSNGDDADEGDQKNEVEAQQQFLATAIYENGPKPEEQSNKKLQAASLLSLEPMKFLKKSESSRQQRCMSEAANSIKNLHKNNKDQQSQYHSNRRKNINSSLLNNQQKSSSNHSEDNSNNKQQYHTSKSPTRPASNLVFSLSYKKKAQNYHQPQASRPKTTNQNKRHQQLHQPQIAPLSSSQYTNDQKQQQMKQQSDIVVDVSTSRPGSALKQQNQETASQFNDGQASYRNMRVQESGAGDSFQEMRVITPTPPASAAAVLLSTSQAGYQHHNQQDHGQRTPMLPVRSDSNFKQGQRPLGFDASNSQKEFQLLDDDEGNNNNCDGSNLVDQRAHLAYDSIEEDIEQQLINNPQSLIRVQTKSYNKSQSAGTTSRHQSPGVSQRMLFVGKATYDTNNAAAVTNDNNNNDKSKKIKQQSQQLSSSADDYYPNSQQTQILHQNKQLRANQIVMGTVDFDNNKASTKSQSLDTEKMQENQKHIKRVHESSNERRKYSYKTLLYAQQHGGKQQKAFQQQAQIASVMKLYSQQSQDQEQIKNYTTDFGTIDQQSYLCNGGQTLQKLKPASKLRPSMHMLCKASEKITNSQKERSDSALFKRNMSVNLRKSHIILQGRIESQKRRLSLSNNSIKQSHKTSDNKQTSASQKRFKRPSTAQQSSIRESQQSTQVYHKYKKIPTDYQQQHQQYLRSTFDNTNPKLQNEQNGIQIVQESDKLSKSASNANQKQQKGQEQTPSMNDIENLAIFNGNDYHSANETSVPATGANNDHGLSINTQQVTMDQRDQRRKSCGSQGTAQTPLRHHNQQLPPYQQNSAKAADTRLIKVDDFTSTLHDQSDAFSPPNLANSTTKSYNNAVNSLKDNFPKTTQVMKKDLKQEFKNVLSLKELNDSASITAIKEIQDMLQFNNLSSATSSATDLNNVNRTAESTNGKAAAQSLSYSAAAIPTILQGQPVQGIGEDVWHKRQRMKLIYKNGRRKSMIHSSYMRTPANAAKTIPTNNRGSVTFASVVPINVSQRLFVGHKTSGGNTVTNATATATAATSEFTNDRFSVQGRRMKSSKNVRRFSSKNYGNSSITVATTSKDGGSVISYHKLQDKNRYDMRVTSSDKIIIKPSKLRSSSIH